MDKGDIIKEICLSLLNRDKSSCIEIAKEKYPFKNHLTEQRIYTCFQMTKVFLRDGFIDRYSGQKLLFPGIFRILKIELPDLFPMHRNWKMTETHMAYWELFPTIDHIDPIARGGLDNEENWVTTSMLRNCAKSNWTLEELGWSIKEPGNLNDWDGLTSLFQKLIQHDKLLSNDSYIKKWNNALTKNLSKT